MSSLTPTAYATIILPWTRGASHISCMGTEVSAPVVPEIRTPSSRKCQLSRVNRNIHTNLGIRETALPVSSRFGAVEWSSWEDDRESNLPSCRCTCRRFGVLNKQGLTWSRVVILQRCCEHIVPEGNEGHDIAALSISRRRSIRLGRNPQRCFEIAGFTVIVQCCQQGACQK